MSKRPSLEERFVYAMGEIKNMPHYGTDDSRRYAMYQLHQAALTIIENALFSAIAIADAARNMAARSESKP